MIRLIKLCLVCCLMLSATFVKAVDAYEELRKIDEDFWKNTISPYYQDQLGRYDSALIDLFSPEWVISQNVVDYLDPFYFSNGLPKLFNEPTPVDISEKPTLDFSEATMLDIISMFYEILQCKVYFRDDREGGYKTKFKYIQSVKTTNDETALDPYFAEICIGNKRYHFCLDYNGKSDQPGNCCLRQLYEYAQNWCNKGSYNKKLDDPDHYVLRNLLLCLEVSRRMIKDGDQSDAYHELPILGAIVIGLKLMNDQIIDKNDFFVTHKGYVFFSGNSREENIKKLLEEFCRYKNFQSVEQFKKEVQRLYKQFIGLKVTDRVLYLDENYPSVIQKYPYCKSLAW